jgi:hypothetical protein
MARTFAAILLVVTALASELAAQGLRGQFEKHVFTISSTTTTFTSSTTAIPVDFTTPIGTRYTGSINVTFPATIDDASLDAAQRYLVPTSSFTSRVATNLNIITKAAQTDITVTVNANSTQSGDNIAELTTSSKRTAQPAGSNAFNPALDCSFSKLAVTDKGTSYSVLITSTVIIETRDSSSIGQTFLTIQSTYVFAKTQINIFPSVGSNAPASGFHEQPLAARITGKDFVAPMKVTIGTLIASTPIVKSSTEIEFVLSGFQGQKDGPRDVVIQYPNSSTQTLPGGFYISNIVPQIQVAQGPPMNCANTPCVAKHDTIVRVSLTCNEANCTTGRNPATGRLTVKRNGVAAGVPVLPTPATADIYLPDAKPSRQQRVSALDTLNFVLNGDKAPDDGNYDFVFELDPRNPKVAPTGSDTNRSLFRTLSSQQFKKTTVPMRIGFLMEDKNTTEAARVLNAFGYLKSVYPISNDLVSVEYVPALYDYSNLGIQSLSDTVSLDGLSDARDVLRDSNGKFFTHLLLFTRSQAFIADGTKGLTWAREPRIGSGPLVVNAPVTIVNITHQDIEAIIAHEIGHTFGFGDSYVDDAATRSTLNPVSELCLSLLTGCLVEDGFIDTVLRTVSVQDSAAPQFFGSRKRDLMGNSPRSDRWIDQNVWDRFYTKIGPSVASTNQVTAMAEPANLIVVSGVIDQSDNVTRLAVRRRSSVADGVSEPGAAYSVELQDAAGNPINSRLFAPSFRIMHRAASAPQTGFLVAMPDSTSARKVVVKKGSTILSTRNISSNVPSPRFVKPAGGSLSGTVAVEWSATDADNDSLTYSLFYAASGSSWTPIARGLTGTTYSWDSSAYAGSSAGKLLLIANDGANEASATSSTFTLPAKQPLAAIVSPPNGTAIALGTSLTFQGAAFDASSRELPAAAIAFSSNISGALGSGRSVSATLAAGRHTITMTASASGLPTASTSIVVDVYNPSRDVRVIPAVGSTPGSAGSFFKTDVQLHNWSASTMAGYITYHRAGASGSDTDPSLTYMLLPRQSQFFSDVLSIFGQSGLGSADLVSTFGSSPLSVTRIYNDPGVPGTNGMTEDVIRTQDALKAGDRGVLIAPDAATARFNIGVRTLTSGVNMTIVVKNSSGETVQTLSKSFDPTYFVQQSAAAFLGRDLTSLDSISFTINSGSAVIYGATTDNKTQDPALQIARPVAPLTATGTRIIPVVGSAPGSLGSFFRTTVTLHNPNNVTITGSIVFHPQGRSGSSTDPKVSYFISPGLTAAYDDLVATMKLTGVGSADLIPATGGTPLVVTRIFNDAGANGTSGMTEDLILPSEALKTGDVATLIAPPDPSRTRFNIGIRTLESGAAMTVTLRDIEGQLIRTVPLQFGPTYFQQTGAAALLGKALAGTDAITFTIDSGSAIVYGATADNVTQDSSLQFARVPK